MPYSWYHLPCMIWVDEKSRVQIIWVHSRARRLGLGTAMIKLSNAKTTYNEMKGSEPFWNSLNSYSLRKGRKIVNSFNV